MADNSLLRRLHIQPGDGVDDVFSRAANVVIKCVGLEWNDK